MERVGQVWRGEAVDQHKRVEENFVLYCALGLELWGRGDVGGIKFW